MSSSALVALCVHSRAIITLWDAQQHIEVNNKLVALGEGQSLRLL
jgi:hypothetical protein